MSNTGTEIPKAPINSATSDARAEQLSSIAAPAAAKTPYWLLWSTGIAAVVLCVAAFVLWGTNGASTLFDMIVALCT
jgi:hypothetical protein